MILPILYIMETPNRGRAVFTSEDIAIGTTIEIAPVIVLNEQDRAKVETTILHDYIFEWGEDEKKAIVALGYVSIYNHAVLPNCMYAMDFEHQTIAISTLRDIKAGEELFINYHNEINSDKPVWFKMQ